MRRRAFLGFVAAAGAGSVLAQGILPPPGDEAWSEVRLRQVERPTVYRDEAGPDGRPGIRAESDCGASMLALPLPEVDLRATPRLSWSWQADVLPTIDDETSKGGDDFAARVYVAFEFDPERASFLERVVRRVAEATHGDDLPGSALIYLWTANAAPGRRWDSPYTATSKMFAVSQGEQPGPQTVQVDVLADYESAFGHAPPPLRGLALMTDADNTCQRASAWYGPFRFDPRPDPGPGPDSPETRLPARHPTPKASEAPSSPDQESAP